MKKSLLALSLWVGGVAGAHAQQETTLSTMRSLPQATYTNPALVPAQPFYLGLPGISSVAAHGGTNSFSYNTLFYNGDETDFSDLSLDQLRDMLKEKNWVRAGAEVDLLSAGVRINPRLYLRYRASIAVSQQTMIPGDLLKLVDESFQASGSTVSLNPAVNGIAYLEQSLGASYTLNERLVVGANLKRLNGIFNIHTDHADLTLTSMPAEGLMRLEGSALLQVSGEEFIDGVADDPDQAEIRKRLRKNGGWGLDMGATYQFNDRLQFGLSIQNLGTITWSTQSREWRITQASTTFEAVTEQDIEEESDRLEAAADSISTYFEPVEQDIAAYRTGLPTKIYATATYELHRSVHASGILFAQVHQGRLMPAFTAAIHKDFGRRLGAALSYTAMGGSYANIGTGLSVRLTPFQLYVVTDNALAGLDYKNAKNANVRVGMNLVFGTIKKESKLPY